MKKIIVMSLMLASMLSFAKKEKIKNKLGLAVKPGVSATSDIRRDVTPIRTENVSSSREKYFSTIDFFDRKWNTAFVEDINVFKNLRSKISSYKDTAVLFLPRGKRIVCLPKSAGFISEVYLVGGQQVPATERNGNVCTKGPVEKILVFSSKVDTKEINGVTVDFKDKVFLNEKRSKEIFK